MELAAFALALTAWRYPDESGNAIGYRQLPELQLACSGQGINTSLEDWKALAEGDTKLEHGLEQLYQLFKDAPTLGSLINPHRVLGSDLVSADWSEIQPLLAKVLGDQQSEEQQELGIVAQGIAKAAELLAGRYHWVVTNVPYLTRQRQSSALRDFIDKYHFEAKAELANVFLERCLHLNNEGGLSQVVIPQNWLFSHSFEKFRQYLLSTCSWNSIARLGAGAFQEISGEVVNVVLMTLSNNKPCVGHQFWGVDASNDSTILEKKKSITTGQLLQLDQNKQFSNPDTRIIFAESHNLPLLGKFAASILGLGTCDAPHYIRNYWEQPKLLENWAYIQSSTKAEDGKSGKESIVSWDYSRKKVHGMSDAERKQGHNQDYRGREAWSKNGVAISLMGKLRWAPYYGSLFDKSVATLIPKKIENLLAIRAYAEADDFHSEVRKLDQKLMVTNATFEKIPFDKEYWQKVAAEKYPNGLPKPYSDDPTQWIFHGHPAKTEEALQVAVARLLGYRWPAELDDEMELSDEARALITRSETLNRYSDDDGIVCIPAVRGEKSAADRLNDLLLAAGTPAVAKLLEQVQCKGKNLEFWLREKFFEQHCKLFHSRPFIWQIWDGQKDGFSALVNYHKLTRKNLEALVYTYLGDWLRTQEQQVNDGIDGADIRLQAARNLEKKLKAIIEGEAPLDIFARWKPESEQPIGWNPDLNDGVRLNIRPFLLCGDVGKKGAGILRTKPNIHWKKDRGKDVPSAPWFKKFGGDRINDYHLTIKEKQAARAKADEEVYP